MKILVLGGYGVFGGRLIELLLDVPDLEIIVSGRNQQKAEEFCGLHHGAATLIPRALERSDIGTALSILAPDVVIDASGPFQGYGENRYIVINACIDASVSYLDFADAADFVFGVSQFDQQAKQAGIFVLSGVSSFPVLSASVLREISKTMEIHSVTGGVAPTPYAGVGLNVMRAILGYAGSPITLFRDGKQAQSIGLAETMRYTIAVPGKLPLRNTHFSLVDVPDLQVLPAAYPELRSIWMGAGPVPETLHKALNWLARIRAAIKLPSFEPLSPVFYRILNLFKSGEHRGGMFIHVCGSINGAPAEQSWHMLAEGDDGPYIPSMAIEALIRKALKGAWPEHGARAATRELELDDYRKLFQGKPITMGFRSNTKEHSNPFKHVLGSAFDDLPSCLRQFHGNNHKQAWQGQAQVLRGSSILAKLVGWAVGFPKEAKTCKVIVTQEPYEAGVRWTRSFDGKKFSSFLKSGSEKNSYLLIEQFGFAKVALALVLEGQKLHLVPRSWSIFSIPMPRFLMPGGETFEEEKDNCFLFNVEISAPVIGHLVSYKGFLEPVAEVQNQTVTYLPSTHPVPHRSPGYPSGSR